MEDTLRSAALGQRAREEMAASPRPDLRDDPAFTAAVDAVAERVDWMLEDIGVPIPSMKDRIREREHIEAIAVAVLGVYRSHGGKL